MQTSKITKKKLNIYFGHIKRSLCVGSGDYGIKKAHAFDVNHPRLANLYTCKMPSEYLIERPCMKVSLLFHFFHFFFRRLNCDLMKCFRHELK